ncbi:hypothetical protein G7046_g4224 [Stylonectria norvegica]|nr:hypothetical protein G7046_g4224 [Stylonectria norvegica]
MSSLTDTEKQAGDVVASIGSDEAAPARPVIDRAVEKSLDLGLVGNQFQLLLILFYIPYALMNVPFTLLSKKYNPSVIIPAIMTIWGIMAMASAGTKNFGGLLACRILMGCVEAAFFPCAILYCSFFYTRHELSFRTSIFGMMGFIAGAISGVIAYSVFQWHKSLSGWQYLFIIEGAMTVGVGLSLFLVLPRSVQKSRWFTPEEKAVALLRLAEDSQDVDKLFHFDDAVKELKDWTTWVYTLLPLLYGVGQASSSNFLPTIVKRIAVIPSKSNLWPNLTAAFIQLSTTWLSDRYQQRASFAVGALFVSFIAWILLATLDLVHSVHVGYFLTYLITFGTFTPGILVPIWIASNTTTTTGRAMRLGLNFMGQNLAGIISSSVFRAQDAPIYKPALITIACTQVSYYKFAASYPGLILHMFGAKYKQDAGGDGDDNSYKLGWPKSQRWQPRYSVPKNSLESVASARPSSSELEKGPPNPQSFAKQKDSFRSMSWGVKRDLDTNAGGGTESSWNDDGDEEFSNLSHWLETLAELYMNDIDNRARFDPRWLNITRRERFEGLASSSVTVFDYLLDDSVQRSERITSKNQLAATLQDRPETSKVRVIMVNDLSRFVMGALGQMYSIDPEFWYEHLVNSGYGASDSGLKLKNAVWMNWVERETKFRHRALPESGQRTEWNVPRRTQTRCWAHLRWGRLGLLNYLGRKGFHEDELERRLVDGRWMMERDVDVDKLGFLMTAKRQAHEEERAKLKRKKQKKKKEKVVVPELPTDTSRRVKTSNVYRPYSSFTCLPGNPSYWLNRDLRVVAPEGVGYWSKVDEDGRKTVILLFDPMRNMRNEKTKETTPSLTFMPRAMEFESYSTEELWRVPDSEETYLDPPVTISRKEAKLQKKAAQKQKLKAKKDQLQKKLGIDHDHVSEPDSDSDSDSYYTSDEEYDEEYQETLTADYRDPKPYTRDRDYARKYALTTAELVSRYMGKLSTAAMLQDDSLVPSILTQLYLDDFWQLLAEIRLGLDHIDADMGADFHAHLLESVGITTRQNVAWMRSTLQVCEHEFTPKPSADPDIDICLQELREWAEHTSHVSKLLFHSPDQEVELDELYVHLKKLQSRVESTLNLLVSSTGLAQSQLVIDQTSGINKLTELAFFFIPLSFITSVFSMQVLELTSSPPRLWIWGVSLAAVFFVTYLIRSMLRSPSFRIIAMQARVTMLHRFTPSQTRSASRRLNSVGNRAIAKFLMFSLTVLVIVTVAFFSFLGFLFLIFGGLWLGTIAVAIYFIVTRWPDLAVVIPCFLSIPLSALGMFLCYYWWEELTDFGVKWCMWSLELIKRIFPKRWTLDSAEDEDLAAEGVNLYARQAIVLATA